MTVCTVWPVHNVPGWEGGADEEPGLYPVRPLVEALTDTYTTDAHFWPGEVSDDDGPCHELAPRVNKAALPHLKRLGGGVVFRSLWVDVDDPEAHKHKVPTTPEWRAAFDAAVQALPVAWSEGAAWYHSRGGARLGWVLSEAVQPDEYELLAAAVRRLLEPLGIRCDDAAPDWTRCLRLPRVVRDGEPLRYPMDLSRLEAGRLDVGMLRAAAQRPKTLLERIKSGEGVGSGGGYKLPESITENRNQELMKHAGHLRRKGLDADSIYHCLIGVVEERCEGWVPEPGELRRIADNAAKYAPPQGVTTEAQQAAAIPGTMTADGIALGSDAELSAKALAEYEPPGAPQLVFDRGELWRYDPARGVWAVLPQHVVQQLVRSWDGQAIVSDAKKPLKLRVSLRMTRDVYGMVCAARHAEGYFGANVEGLTMRNGFVRAGPDGVSLEPWAPEQRSTVAMPYEYTPGAQPRAFLSMLAGCFAPDGDEERDGKVQLLREWIGAALLGRATVYQQAVVLFGERASNGKSEVLRVIRALFPPDAVSAIPPQLFGDPVALVDLSKARLNMVGEMEEGEILQTAGLKSVIAGEQLRACQKYALAFTFTPAAGHVFSANALPSVRDKTDGFWRRWVVLPFNRRFSGGEVEREIGRRVIGQELGEIASWVVEGYAQLARRGAYEPTPQCLEALAEWRGNADNVAKWVAEHCTRGETWTPARELFHAWQRWALGGGYKVTLTEVTFAKRLRYLGIEDRKSSVAQYRLAPAPGVSSTLKVVRPAP